MNPAAELPAGAEVWLVDPLLVAEDPLVEVADPPVDWLVRVASDRVVLPAEVIAPEPEATAPVWPTKAGAVVVAFARTGRVELAVAIVLLAVAMLALYDWMIEETNAAAEEDTTDEAEAAALVEMDALTLAEDALALADEPPERANGPRKLTWLGPCVMVRA